MTRCIEQDAQGSWHVRIADVVRQLLNGLATEEFAYDFLIDEGRENAQRVDMGQRLEIIQSHADL